MKVTCNCLPPPTLIHRAFVVRRSVPLSPLLTELAPEQNCELL